MFKSNVVFTVYRGLVLEILYSLQQCEFVICNKYFNRLCVLLLLCTSMCVCVCVRERERERERSRTHTHTHTHTNRDREKRKYFKAVFAQTHVICPFYYTNCILCPRNNGTK